MAFLTRYVDDDSRPTVGSALRDIVVRAVLPAIVLWLVIVGIGKLIEGPLGGLEGESSINRSLQAGRTATWDAVTMVWSHIGNTEIVIGVCVVMVALIWWLTKQWWVAIIPAIAIAIQATVFVLATAVTGRDRPQVEHLDPAPPTLVAYARLYRGMHHLTDVLVGFLNGIVFAFLAWNYLRRRRKA